MSSTTIVFSEDMPLDDMAHQMTLGIGANDHVRLDLSRLHAPGLWIVQLIAAARKEASTRDVRLELAPSPAGSFHELLDASGLLTAATSEETSFWTGANAR